VQGQSSITSVWHQPIKEQRRASTVWSLTSCVANRSPFKKRLTPFAPLSGCECRSRGASGRGAQHRRAPVPYPAAATQPGPFQASPLLHLQLDRCQRSPASPGVCCLWFLFNTVTVVTIYSNYQNPGAESALVRQWFILLSPSQLIGDGGKKSQSVETDNEVS